MPVDPQLFLSFIPAAMVLIFLPGADMMFCLGQGLQSGPRAAFYASLGIATGAMIQVFLAGLGLGAAVLAHPGVVDVIKWFGAAYLLWLAYEALISGMRFDPGATPAVGQAYREATVVNLTNPKYLLFVLAFLPHFVSVEAGPILPQFLFLGLFLALGGVLVNSLVGGFAGLVRRWLVGSERMAALAGRMTAVIFTLMAFYLLSLPHF